MTENNAAQAAIQETVRHVLEPYAESYDTMTRIADREGRESVVSPSSVAFDIRENMVKSVVDALSKLRAEGAQAGDERESFSDWAWKKDGLAIGHMDGQAAAWEAWQERARRAALASAPVAAKGQS